MCRLRNIALESMTEKCDRRTDRQTDRRRTKWSLCAAMLRRRHKNHIKFCWKPISLLSSYKMLRKWLISKNVESRPLTTVTYGQRCIEPIIHSCVLPPDVYGLIPRHSSLNRYLKYNLTIILWSTIIQKLSESRAHYWVLSKQQVITEVQVTQTAVLMKRTCNNEHIIIIYRAYLLWFSKLLLHICICQRCVCQSLMHAPPPR